MRLTRCNAIQVLMEELSTLATGFEVDGGQLRYQLYVWLEKEVEVLKVLCNYGLPEEVTSLPEGVLWGCKGGICVQVDMTDR